MFHNGKQRELRGDGEGLGEMVVEDGRSHNKWSGRYVGMIEILSTTIKNTRGMGNRGRGGGGGGGGGGTSG